jgi:hypothetical protein
MKPRILSKRSLGRTVVVICGIAVVLTMAGCGGSGGGPEPIEPTTVTISGKVDDGTANSPIQNAQCRFEDQNKVQYAFATSNQNGVFSMEVLPNIEGQIKCGPNNMGNLELSTYASTIGESVGGQVTENVSPAHTIVDLLIQKENPPDKKAFKKDLMDKIKAGSDPHLNRVVELATLLFKSMLNENIDVDYGGGGGGDGDSGVGGDAGDGGDTSPIANARCEFVVSNDLKSGNALYSAALADFLDDGILNRPDLIEAKKYIDPVVAKYGPEAVKEAFGVVFKGGIGHPFVDTTDASGKFFLEIPPNVPGFVRCMPPGQERLVLGTYVPKLLEGEKRLGESVNPATTVFSTNVAAKLDEDLDPVKDNYENGILGLEVRIERVGESVTGFTIGDTGVISGESIENKPAKWVAFSATALFNIFYKNGEDVDYLAALNDLTVDGEVDAAFLQSQGIAPDQAEEYQRIVNADIRKAGLVLDQDGDLQKALKTARINVTVIDAAGAIVPVAELNIVDADEGIICENCPLETTGDTGQYLVLTGVPLDETVITLEASKEGYEPIPAKAKVVALATVDLTIELANQFTLDLQMAGTGSGRVSADTGDIDCSVDNAVESGICNADLKSGTLLTLTAIADEGSTFTGWGGDCSGAGPCLVTMDRAKNVTATFSLEADIEFPKVTITSPTSGSSYETKNSTLSIGGTASDDVGVTQVSWSNSRGGSGTCTGTSNWSASGITLLDGTNVITVTAGDAAGKTATDRLTVTYINDIGSPTVTITSPTSGSSYETKNSTLSIGGTASDDVGVTQVSWSNSRGGSGTCTGTSNWSASGIALYSGTNVITVTARDAAGKTATDRLTVTYINDIGSPTVTITSPTSGSSYETKNSTLSIGGTASDDVGVTQVSWSNSRGGSGTCTGTSNWSASGIALYSGTNVITVTARDAAGKTATDTLTVNADISFPRVTITSPTSGSTYITSYLYLSIAGT